MPKFVFVLLVAGLVLMEYLKEKVKDSCDPSDSTEYSKSLDKSNLLKVDVGNVMSDEEIKSFLCYSTKR